jgi:MFS transporter, AAHS family, 4-hydroxybenzoate transporter
MALESINLSELMEAQASVRFQYMMLVLLCCFMAVEGYDMLVLGYAAPAMIKAFHASKPAFGIVFGSAMFGFMVGALLIGTVGDKLGRKTAVVGGLCTFGAFNIAITCAPNITILTILCMLAGVGLGGAVPNAIALMVEYSPKHRRTVYVCLLYIGYNIGAALTGYLAARLVPTYGWKSVFILGGILPLTVALLLSLTLPESLHFLTLSHRSSAKIKILLRRIRPDLRISENTRIFMSEETRKGVPVKHLFTEERAAMSLLLWTGAIGTMMTEHFITSWLPLILTTSGIGMSKAITASAILLTVGPLGSIFIGFAMARFGSIALAVLLAFGVPCVIGLGHVGYSEAFLMVLVASAGFCLIGGLTGLNALAGTIYPTYMRSTGIGWSGAMARLGAIIGPSIGGILLSFNQPLATVFVLAAMPSAIGAVSILVLSRRAVGNRRPAPAQPLPVADTNLHIGE